MNCYVANFVVNGGTGVVMTAYGATSDDNVGIMISLGFQWIQTGFGALFLVQLWVLVYSFMLSFTFA